MPRKIGDTVATSRDDRRGASNGPRRLARRGRLLSITSAVVLFLTGAAPGPITVAPQIERPAPPAMPVEAPGPHYSGPWFEDVTVAAGLERVGSSFGASWGDVDGDRLPDLWLSNHLQAAVLYVNQGDGSFADDSAAWNVCADPEMCLLDTHGAAWADFDGDGDLDLLQLSGGEQGAEAADMPNVLYVNDGASFTDEAAARGLDAPVARGRTPLWVDWEGDGVLDVVLSNLARTDGQAPLEMFTQTAGSFADSGIGLGAGVAQGTFSQLVGVGDPADWTVVIRDNPYPGKAVRPTPGGFDDVTAALFPGPKPLWGVRDAAVADFDGDLDMDLFLATALSPAELAQLDANTAAAVLKPAGSEQGFRFRTTGSLDFTVAGAVADEIYLGASGAHPADRSFTVTPAEATGVYAGDRSEGLFVSYDPGTDLWEVAASTGVIVAVRSANPVTDLAEFGFTSGDGAHPDRLLTYDGGSFSDTSAAAGITGPTACVSVAAADFDNDTDVDVFVACGSQLVNGPDLLYENLGGGSFALVPEAGGATGTSVGVADTVSAADYDLDGYVDLVVTNGLAGPHMIPLHGPELLFRNVRSGNNWLEVDLHGVVSNPHGIGARVYVEAGGITQVRDQAGGIHSLGQHDMRVHFGLGGASEVDRLTVEWPSGEVQVLEDLAVNRLVQVVEPSQPNIVLINTDDQRFDMVADMPHLQAEMGLDGTVFTGAFTVTPLCCPSRASMLTGRYASNTGVLANGPPMGGAALFDPSDTVATRLHDAGYRTGLFGKYLNNFDAGSLGYVPPGWDTFVEGQGYFDWPVAIDGIVHHLGYADEDYSTDMLAGRLTDFMADAAGGGEPFFAYFAPYAPHQNRLDVRETASGIVSTELRRGAAVPARRHDGSFAGTGAPRPPSFDEADVSDKPAFVQEKPRLDPGDTFLVGVSDPGYAEAGFGWGDAPGAGHDGGPARVTKDVGASASWDVPEAGAYDVSIYVPDVSWLTADARIGVGATKVTDYYVNLAEAAGGWVHLGNRHMFGANRTLTLDNASGSGRLAAGPVRFVRTNTIEAVDTSYEQAYEAMLAVDDAIGSIFATLRALDLDDNTVVIFTSDNGFLAGEHRLMGKRYFYDESVGVPLFVRDGRLPWPHVSDEYALNIDLAPTVLDLAGVGADPAADGRSLAPLIRGEDPGDWRDDFMIEGPDGKSAALRTRDYYYIEHETGEVELYDLAADPWQLDNIGDDPVIAPPLRDRLAELRPPPQAGPVVVGLAVDPATIDEAQGTLAVSASVVADPGVVVGSAEVFVDAPGTVGKGVFLAPVDGVFDSSTEEVAVVAGVGAAQRGIARLGVLAPGPHTLFVHGRDRAGNWGPYQTIPLTVAAADPAVPALLSAIRPDDPAVFRGGPALVVPDATVMSGGDAIAETLTLHGRILAATPSDRLYLPAASRDDATGTGDSVDITGAGYTWPGGTATADIERVVGGLAYDNLVPGDASHLRTVELWLTDASGNAGPAFQRQVCWATGPGLQRGCDP